MKPSVSVLMPVFNGGAHLLESIESVLTQTFVDFELIVVDDGSTDETPELLAAVTDPRVRVVRQDNCGMAAALNAGLQIARADVVARMDADDRSRPQRLALQLEYLRAHPDLSVIGAAFQVLDTGGVLHEIVAPLLLPDDVRRDLFVRCPFGHGTVMARTNVLRDVGGYDGSHWPADDYDLWRRLAEKGHGLANLPEVLYDYRVYDGTTRSGRDAPVAAERVRTDVWRSATPELPAPWTVVRRLITYRRASADNGGDFAAAYVAQHLRLLVELVRRGRRGSALRASWLLLFAPYPAIRSLLRRARSARRCQ